MDGGRSLSLSGALRRLLFPGRGARPGPPRASALSAALRPGDVVLHRDQGDLLGGLIGHFTASPYSHAELYYGGGWSLSAEAHGIAFAATDRGGRAFVDVCRHPGLSAARTRRLLAAARATLARRYEFTLLFGFPYLARRAVLRRAANRGYICSEHVAWAYRQAGVILVPERPQSLHAPADLAHSPALRYVASFHGCAPVTGAQLNHYHPRQGRRSWLAVALIELLAKPVSLRDEYYRALAASQRHYAPRFRAAVNIFTPSASQGYVGAAARSSGAPAAELPPVVYYPARHGGGAAPSGEASMARYASREGMPGS